MKHDLEAFSRDIVSLIKTSGDTGGSGDTIEKLLEEQGHFCPHSSAQLCPHSN